MPSCPAISFQQMCNVRGHLSSLIPSRKSPLFPPDSTILMSVVSNQKALVYLQELLCYVLSTGMFWITHCNGCLFITVSHTGTGVLSSSVIMSSINSAVNPALKAECTLPLPAAFSGTGHSQLLLLNLPVHEQFVTDFLTFQHVPFLQATLWSEFHSSEFYFFATDITELYAVFFLPNKLQ